MTQVWMGRAYRENRRAMLAALERNKDKLEAAMDEALEKVEASGRQVGAEIAARRTSPAPGRIGSKIKRPAPPKADSLVETVTAAMPAARFIGCVDVEPEPAPGRAPIPRPAPRLLEVATRLGTPIRPPVESEHWTHESGIEVMWKEFHGEWTLFQYRGPGLEPLLLTSTCLARRVVPPARR